MAKNHERKPKRTRGEIGSTMIIERESGIEATIIPAELPANKEELEVRFAQPFKEAFNRELPLGPEVTLSIVRQNDTSDLDFLIDSPIAEFLELAELTPLETEFGRAALETGALRPYDFATWTYHKIIRHKASRYGPDVARKTLLLLYITHWQFLPSNKMVGCLQSYCSQRPVDFAGIFLLRTNGSDLVLLETIAPFDAEPRPAPAAYKCEPQYFNGAPGETTWSVDTALEPPAYPEPDERG